MKGFERLRLDFEKYASKVGIASRNLGEGRSPCYGGMGNGIATVRGFGYKMVLG